MPRTTIALVKGIIETEQTDPIITNYINAANTMVNSVLGSSTLGEVLLAEIERWLAAHMIATTRERTAFKEGAGGAFIEYSGQFGMGLKSTSYGQMVLMLDTTGLMAALAGKSAKITAITSFK